MSVWRPSSAAILRRRDLQWQYPKAQSYIPDDGAWNATDGDSLQCRAYHAAFPAADNAAMHCPHAGGAAPCAAE